VEQFRGRTRVGGAGPRDLLGEIEVFAQCPRVCTVTAAGPLVLYALSQEGINALCASGNPVVFAIERAVHRRISDRLRLLDVAIGERATGEPFVVRPPAPSLLERLTGRNRKERPVDPDPAATLQGFSLFSWAEPAWVAHIAQYATVEHFEPESVIFRQGEDGDRMHLVASGQVEVAVALDGGRAERIAVLSAGHGLGDSALELGAPRTRTAVARTATVTLSFDRRNYLQLYERNDPIGSVFRQALTQNLVLQFLATLDRFVAVQERWDMNHPQVNDRIAPMGGVWRD
jgi:CRP-like cAMP-binding protein